MLTETTGLTTAAETAAPKEKITFTSAERIMSLAAAALGVGVIHFIFWNITGFFTTAVYFALITFLLIALVKGGKKLRRFHKVWAGVMYLFSLVFSVTANSFIKGLDVIFLTMGCAYLVYSVWTEKNGFGGWMPLDMAAACTVPVSELGKESKAFTSAVTGGRSTGHIKGILGGLILAAPLTAVVGSLLMSADDGVARILSRIILMIRIDSLWDLLLEIVFSILAAGYIFGMIWTGLHPKEEARVTDASGNALCSKLRRFSPATLCTMVTPICLLYVIFFISQASYFLSAFFGRLPESYSYAEYARQGFFELFTIELINGAVILGINLGCRREGEGKPRSVRVYTVIIGLFTIIMCAIALSKMVLYINCYGLTQLRVYTSWFMVLTAVIFVFIIVRQLRPGFRIMNACAWSFTVMFALLCFSRPDALIARFNLEYCAQRLNSYDIEEMIDMSTDAAAVILEPRYAFYLSQTADRLPKSGLTASEHALGLIYDDSYALFNLSALKLAGEI